MTRIALLMASLVMVPMVAEAGRDGGGRGGGGALGGVSSGMGGAAGGGGSRGGGGGGNVGDPCQTGAPQVYTDSSYTEVEEAEPAEDPDAPRPTKIDIYVGAQKVMDSTASISAELAFTQRRFRLAGTLTRYYEDQGNTDPLTMTIPTLTIGWRIDDLGPTRVYVEVGAAGARTRHDPVMDTSVAGVIGGVRIEHRTSPKLAVVGDAHAYVFDHDIRAGELRAGIRFNHVQASLRYLDFNVGPALWGPEVGVAF